MKKSRSTKRAITRRSFVGAGLAALALGGCAWGGSQGGASAGGSSAATVTAQDFLFDTIVEMEAACSQELLDAALERLRFFESKFSRTLEGSDVWNVNHALGAACEVAPETAELVEQALGFCEESGGRFDITIGAASQLWDFEAGVRPDDAALAEAVTHIDYRKVFVEGSTLRLADPAAVIDLGGIAKGYAADAVVALLREGGCEDAYLNLGGNVYVMGESFDGDAWVVGVRDPEGAQDAIATIGCADLSVVTSGVYERSFEEDGRRYHHILDPATGAPCESGLAGVTVAAESSCVADAYSTILFMLGRNEALVRLEGDARLAGGIVVEDGGEALVSAGSSFELL